MRVLLGILAVACMAVSAFAEVYKWRRGYDVCFVCGMLAGMAITGMSAIE